jgi:hypothetical protein
MSPRRVKDRGQSRSRSRIPDSLFRGSLHKQIAATAGSGGPAVESYGSSSPALPPRWSGETGLPPPEAARRPGRSSTSW